MMAKWLIPYQRFFSKYAKWWPSGDPQSKDLSPIMLNDGQVGDPLSKGLPPSMLNDDQVHGGSPIKGFPPSMLNDGQVRGGSPIKGLSRSMLNDARICFVSFTLNYLILCLLFSP